MKAKKFSCFILAALFALFTVFTTLTACAPHKTQSDATDSDSNSDGNNASAADGDTASNPEETTQEKYQFPEANYNSYNMRVLVPDHDDWAMSTIMAEEENGDAINDAIY